MKPFLLAALLLPSAAFPQDAADPTGFASGAISAVYLGHSTALSGALVSPINPRAILIGSTTVFADGAAYSGSGTRTVKIIVLMTDGTNTWTAASGNPVTGSTYSAYGYFTNADGSKPNARLPSANANPSTSDKARAAMDALTAESCTNAKATGITIYSVGFSVATDPIDGAGQTLLSNCASQSGNYFLASDSTALNTAFGSIAQGIGQLRLTH